jgi:arylsulfatase
MDFSLPKDLASGVLLAQGGRYGGYSIYLEGGRPVYHYNAVGAHQFTIASGQAIPAGDHTLTVDFTADDEFDRMAFKGGPGGRLTISVDGREVAAGRIARTLLNWYSDSEGLDIGVDNNSPVTDAYPVSDNTFPGIIRRTRFTIR